MNAKRRAELQRRLTLNAVPRPPAGLAERIKADIPKYLEAETGRDRFARSITLNMRVAASIVVLATSVVVAMMVVSPKAPQPKLAGNDTAARPVIFPPARAAATTDTMSPPPAARTEVVNLDIVEEAAGVPQLAVAGVPPPSIAPSSGDFADETRVRSGVERDAAATGAVAEGVIGGSAAAPPPEPQIAEVAPRQDLVAAPPGAERESFAPPAAPAPAPPVAQSITVTSESAAASDTRRERTVAKVASGRVAFAEAKKNDVFGITVDAQVFHDIRTTLESGRRPAASAVNVEALVNYFAGPPAKWPRRGIHLEVEVSPAALPAEGDHAVLRFTIDTPAPGGAEAAVASDARIDVAINDDVVARARRVGDGDPLARESTLSYGTSVTGLYALELKPGLGESQLVATVRLHYVAGGRRQVITKEVHGHDLTKSWQRASRRHRLASLGALWGESLRGTSGGVDVARRAEELATQDPEDVRARELARAASASAAGGR